MILAHQTLPIITETPNVAMVESEVIMVTLAKLDHGGYLTIVHRIQML